METIDNIYRRLGDDLKETLKRGSTVSIAAASFSMYAYEALSKELNAIDELRFVFTSPTFIEEEFRKDSRRFYIPHIERERELCGGEFEVRLQNALHQRSVVQECSAWVRQKVRFKSNVRRDLSMPGMIHIAAKASNGKAGATDDGTEEYAYSNLNSFTTADLGFTHKEGFPTLIQRCEYPHSSAYLRWFNQIWNDSDRLEDVTAKVQEYFESAYKENSPDYIYFITLYNIFRDFLDDVSAESFPNDRIGFKNTIIWEKLYNFQRDAVIGAINKLERYNGCILADSVGLGKTFSALGIIKYYEMRNKDVLVLCPKKLEENWNVYRYNDKRNIFAGDKFRYDVLFHTDLSRERGISNGRELEHVNWGNYGLVVIDESHNFRNNNTVVGKENRYQKLLRKVIREGIDTKVLMLSATPVNNRFNDLRNQLALAYKGEPSLIDAQLETKSGIETVFSQAQKAFNQWSKFPVEKRTASTLLQMLEFDFFEILDALTIARSRKHITTYYDTTAIGTFPKRNKPISIQSAFSAGITYEAIAENLMLLHLAVYKPVSYILPSQIQRYQDRYDRKVQSSVFTQLDRESNLQVLMRINLLKRLESSVDSFRQTLDNIIVQLEKSLAKIVAYEARQTQATPPRANTQEETTVETIITEETNDEENEEKATEKEERDEPDSIGEKIKISLADMDLRRWKEDLQADLASLRALRQNILPSEAHTTVSDTKLRQLLELLDDKITNPPIPGNRKVIIFTAFADTATYLYKSIAEIIKTKYGLNTALITGSRKTSNATTIPADLNTLLTCFSPVSKAKAKLYPDTQESIDILIATDCISEGQNLQDCDYLINYDIHWNPVRIIQRFGRIDRIGSRNPSITMVNFWPDVSLDNYIKLKTRVESKMLITDMTGTGDDNILNTEEQDLEYRKIQLQKLQEEVIDLEDLREGVSITDLGMQDFRIDLAQLLEDYNAQRTIPEGLHTVVAANENFPRGVLFVLQNITVGKQQQKQNRLHPYYILYITSEGVYLNYTEPKKVLDVLRMLCRGKKEPLQEPSELVRQETKDYHVMDEYSQLLKSSIESIMGIEKQKRVESLFTFGGTASGKEQLKGMEDFKLVTFVIVR